MPPKASTPGLQNIQPHERKRSVPSRIVPAIPLALSRPKAKPTKPPAKPEEASPQEQGHIVEGKEDGDERAKSDGAVSQGNTEQIELNVAATTDAAEANGLESSSVDILSVDNTPSVAPGVELSEGERAEKVATPPASSGVSVPPTPDSANSTRKQANGHIVRPIRTELPPAFVPAAGLQSPQSATSSHPSRTLHSHVHAPSSGSRNIVFGGQDSSTSSPAPPQSANSAYAPPHFVASSEPRASHAASLHAHHNSEPQHQRVYYGGYGAQGVQWPMHQHSQPQHGPTYYHSHGHQQFRYPPREVFTPTEVSAPTNGHLNRSRSTSHNSSAFFPNPTEGVRSPHGPLSSTDNAKPPFSVPKGAMPSSQFSRQRDHIPEMSPPPQVLPAEVHFAAENAEALRTHVQAHFSNASFSDCRLHLTEEGSDVQQSIDAHSVILSRSPTLSKLIDNTQSIESPKPEVRIPLKGRYMSVRPLIDAVRYLYGGSLLQLELLRLQTPGEGSGVYNEEQMRVALQYVASGAWLQVPAIAMRAVEVVGMLLVWETIATALAFALEGGLSHVWSVEDGSEDRMSSSSSDDSVARTESAHLPTYDPYATQILHRVVHFTVHMLPQNFYLDASAPQLPGCPRLPALPEMQENRLSHSDPRLRKIRFGEIPSADHQRPSFVTTTISSIFLSLPFALLKCLLEHYDLAARLGPETVASIMRQVVAEREVRRTKALAARIYGQIDDGANAHLVQNLYWEEAVEPSSQLRAGFRLARKRRGIDTPPSSGADSERSK